MLMAQSSHEPRSRKTGSIDVPRKSTDAITFRLATLFVAFGAIGSLALDRLNGPGSPPEATSQIRKLVPSPGFLTLHALVLMLSFWLIYWTREKKQYYRFRVFFYGCC